LIVNTRAAAAVFMTDDPQAARLLIGEKEVFRALETRATGAVLGRENARSGNMEARRLHLDIARDLKRVNAHLSAAAYPVLERRGELLTSRLRQDAETEQQ